MMDIINMNIIMHIIVIIMIHNLTRNIIIIDNIMNFIIIKNLSRNIIININIINFIIIIFIQHIMYIIRHKHFS